MIPWLFVLATALVGVRAAMAEAPDAARLADIAQAASSSLVRVEYTLQYDHGDAPYSRGPRRRCPNCGAYHVDETDTLVKDERPLVMPGFLLSPTLVMSTDPILHPRFVRSIGVRRGDEAVGAKVAAYAMGQNAVTIELERPLAGARPLAFEATAKPPYFTVTYNSGDGGWTTLAQALPVTAALSDAGRRFSPVPSNALITDGAGVPVGLVFSEELPLDDSWKGAPRAADWMAAETLQEELRRIPQSSIVHVSLGLRSPKEQSGGRRYSISDDEMDDMDENTTATERETLGVVFEPSRVLVLAALQPKTTARLEQITVHRADGPPIAGEFQCSLKEFGGFVATLASPIAEPVRLSRDDLMQSRHRLLRMAEISVRGEKRIVHLSHDRLPSFETAWLGREFPKEIGDRSDTFIFDERGALLALPIERREKVSVREEYSSNETRLTPASYLSAVLSDLSGENVDGSNSPLREGEEGRIAWMGVELQALNRELARANGVSDLTANGETGALVTFVYPDSPAAATGVRPGDILLRLHIPAHPKPMDVRLQEEEFGFSGFTWEQLQDVPAQYLDRLPTPWPAVENAFTRSLTDLGFGTAYSAEFCRSGEIIRRDYMVVQSPPHFGSAAKYKSESLGLTVRDLTYEVRRYFRSSPTEPGVVVSRIEPGGKACVGKILPYEVVTHVNAQPVTSVEVFEQLLQGQTQVHLSVKHKAVGRVVKIDLGPVNPTPDEDSTEP